MDFSPHETNQDITPTLVRCQRSSSATTMTYQSPRRFTASACAELNRKMERSGTCRWPWNEGRRSKRTQPRAGVASTVTIRFPCVSGSR